MKNYLVISYLPDTSQIVFDTVLAETEDGAEAEVRRVRGEDIEVGEIHGRGKYSPRRYASRSRRPNAPTITIPLIPHGPRW